MPLDEGKSHKKEKSTPAHKKTDESQSYKVYNS